MNNGQKPVYPTGRIEGGNGLSKREHISALAMQGLLANSDISELFRGSEGDSIIARIAEVSVRNADALLAELEKPQS